MANARCTGSNAALTSVGRAAPSPRVAYQDGLPAEIVMDGAEFTGRALFAWSARTGMRLRFIPDPERVRGEL